MKSLTVSILRNLQIQLSIFANLVKPLFRRFSP
jgi:hypothetical protein